MKLRHFVMALACLMGFTGLAAAQDTPVPLYRGADLTVALVAAAAEPGAVTLTLRLENRGGACDLSLFDPRWGDEPASLGRAWADVQLALAAGETRDETVTVESDDPDAPADTVSLRFACGGRISGPAVIALAGDGFAASEAAEAAEPLFGAAVALARPPRPVTLRDTLTAEELAKLDYGQAQICLRTENGAGEALFAPVATVPLTVDAFGRATGVYSGLYLLLDAAPEVPFRTVERADDGRFVIQAHTIALSGEAVEFAEQTLEIALQDGEARLTAQPVEAWETGGACDAAPCDLYDTVILSHQLFAMPSDGAGGARLQEKGSLNARTPVDGQMTLSLVPADSVGDIWVYCEYFFTDNTDHVRCPAPLPAADESN